MAISDLRSARNAGLTPNFDNLLDPTHIAQTLAMDLGQMGQPDIISEALRIGGCRAADGFDALGPNRGVGGAGASPQDLAKGLEALGQALDQIEQALGPNGGPQDIDPRLLELLQLLVQFLIQNGALPSSGGGGAPAGGGGAPGGPGPASGRTAGHSAAAGGHRAAPTFGRESAPGAAERGGQPGTPNTNGQPADVGAVPHGRGTVGDFLQAALAQNGDRYVYGAEANPNNPNPSRFDCSELVEWAAARAGVRIPDGSSNQRAATRRISVEEAKRTPGALLFRPGHVAISLGDGRTIEARNSRAGVGIFDAGNRFTSGGLIQGMQYG